MGILFLTIFQILFLILTLDNFTAQVLAAGQDTASVEILVGGKKFLSFQEYAQVKSPLSVQAPVLEQAPEAVRIDRVAGVSPSVGEIVRDFHNAPAVGRPLYQRQEFAAALAQAVGGKTGPILLVADGNKVRVMELKP